MPVTGKMISINIKKACEAKDYIAPCAGVSCSPYEHGCIHTALRICEFPMVELSQKLCNTGESSDCSLLDDVFVYSLPSDGSYDGISTVAKGNNNENKSALCAKRKGKFKIRHYYNNISKLFVSNNYKS